jgi:hypothetical protein
MGATPRTRRRQSRYGFGSDIARVHRLLAKPDWIGPLGDAAYGTDRIVLLQVILDERYPSLGSDPGYWINHMDGRAPRSSRAEHHSRCSGGTGWTCLMDAEWFPGSSSLRQPGSDESPRTSVSESVPPNVWRFPPAADRSPLVAIAGSLAPLTLSPRRPFSSLARLCAVQRPELSVWDPVGHL